MGQNENYSETSYTIRDGEEIMIDKSKDIVQDYHEINHTNYELENEKKMSLQEEESSSTGLIVGLTVTVIVLVIVVVVGAIWHRKRSKSRQIITYLLTPYEQR